MHTALYRRFSGRINPPRVFIWNSGGFTSSEVAQAREILPAFLGGEITPESVVVVQAF